MAPDRFQSLATKLNQHGCKSVTAEITDAANGIVQYDKQYDKHCGCFCFWSSFSRRLSLPCLFLSIQYHIPFSLMPTRSDGSYCFISIFFFIDLFVPTVQYII